MNHIVDDPSAEYVILMDTVRDLALPHPSSAKLVSVTSLIEKHIAVSEGKTLGLQLGNADGRHITQVQVTALDVRYTQASIFRRRDVVS